MPLQTIRRASNPKTAAIEHVRIHHRRTHICVAKQFLHGPDVVPVLEQVCRKRVPERMAARSLRHPGLSHRRRHGSLNGRLVQVKPRWPPHFGSRQIRAAGNTNCRAHSDAACGYFLASASGMATRPLPAAMSRACWRCTSSRCMRRRCSAKAGHYRDDVEPDTTGIQSSGLFGSFVSGSTDSATKPLRSVPPITWAHPCRRTPAPASRRGFSSSSGQAKPPCR